MSDEKPCYVKHNDRVVIEQYFQKALQEKRCISVAEIAEQLVIPLDRVRHICKNLITAKKIKSVGNVPNKKDLLYSWVEPKKGEIAPYRKKEFEPWVPRKWEPVRTDADDHKRHKSKGF
jgi:hypothetical protein